LTIARRNPRPDDEEGGQGHVPQVSEAGKGTSKERTVKKRAKGCPQKGRSRKTPPQQGFEKHYRHRGGGRSDKASENKADGSKVSQDSDEEGKKKTGQRGLQRK